MRFIPRMAKKLAKGKKREVMVRFLATPKEKDHYETAGIDTDQSMSAWIRKTLNEAIGKMHRLDPSRRESRD